VQRRAGKLPAGVSIEKELADARADVLRTAVELPLVKRSAERARPRPLLPPPPPPPPAELDPRLVRWCRNQGGTNADPNTIVQCVSRGRYERQKRHRTWHPIGCSEQSELAAKLARREACDDLCTCAQGTPSFLCHVNVCFATAAGSRCEERRLPVEDCDCMGWQYDGGGGRDQNTCPYRITPPLDPDRHLLDEYSMQYMMRWQPPVPASGWPVFDSGPEERAAERAEQERRLRHAARRMQQDPVACLRAWIAEAGQQLGLKS
jgi:hypothetical protein